MRGEKLLPEGKRVPQSVGDQLEQRQGKSFTCVLARYAYLILGEGDWLLSQ